MPKIQTTLRLLWPLFSLMVLAACQPSPAEVQTTVNAQVALAVAATQSALPTATAYATATTQPTQIPQPSATSFPEQPALATATEYPTATMYPTNTPEPTNTPAPILPTAPPAAGAGTAGSSGVGSAPASPLQTQMALLDQMTLLHNLLIEFQGSVGILTSQDSTDCNRLIQIYDTIKAMPQMDVSGADAIVQQAYAAYRSAIDHFTKPETTPGDIVTLCKTQPENLKNIPDMQINAIALYVGQSNNLMEVAWQSIGGR